MKKTNLILLLISTIQPVLSAQQAGSYMPVEFRHAYEAGTRSMDGLPGPAYWQNLVDYTMEVTVDPFTQTLEGSSEILFRNQSPDELTGINFRLLGNVYKKGAIRGYTTVAENITDGVRIKEIRIGNQYLDPDRSQRVFPDGTNLYILLEHALKPGDSLTAGFRWEQVIPKLIDYQRAGAVDSSRMFVAYWYPQVAVYDDIYGWDRVEYNLVNEFYNNLADFKVNVTVPGSYQVWATGTLMNPEEVMAGPVLNRFRKAHGTDKTVRVVSGSNRKQGTSETPTTWKFEASKVTDFAFVLGSNFLWDASTIEIDGKDVFVQTVYPESMSGGCENLLDLHKETILHLSEDIPGVPFPYPGFTTAIGTGSGGMEFPMMANNSGPDQETNIHEIFHTYLPMLVRVNERRWSWMDEGWAEHTTYLLMNRFFHDPPREDKIFSSDNMLILNRYHGTAYDLPIITTSQFYNQDNHGFLTYSVPSLILSILHQYLGDEQFLACYREFILRWSGKAPTPYDLFNTFENVSGKELDWLLDPWVFQFGVADLGILSVEGSGVTIGKKGNRPVPVILDVTYRDGTVDRITRSAAVWINNESIRVPLDGSKEVESIDLNMEMVDRNLMDNLYPPYAERNPLGPEYSDLAGTYISGYGSHFTFSYENGALYNRGLKYEKGNVLVQTGENAFCMLQDKSTHFIFHRDETGKVTGFELELEQYGFSVNFTKAGSSRVMERKE